MVRKEMLKDGLDPRRIRAIYHTHAHFDHVQADCFFQQQALSFSKHPIPVYVPRKDLFRMTPEYDVLKSNFGALYDHFPKFPFSVMRKMIFEAQIILVPSIHYKIPLNILPLDDQQLIQLGQRTGRVYWTGGHTEGHFFIHIPDDINFLLTGDHDAMNEFICNWHDVLNSVRLAASLNPDNVGIGHNKARIGHKSAMDFISSYFRQFDSIFAPMLKHFHKGRSISMSRIIRDKMGWLHKIGGVDLWAHMALFAIGKYLEELNLGYMTLSPPFELSFTITEDLEKIDLIHIIRYGE